MKAFTGTPKFCVALMLVIAIVLIIGLGFDSNSLMTETIHSKGMSEQNRHRTHFKNGPHGTVRKCSTQERLKHIENYCESKGYGRYSPSLHGTDPLEKLSDKEILSLSHELWLDTKNQVIVCMHAKVGCSTWKHILANNTIENPLPNKLLGASIHSQVFKLGMKCADEGSNVTEIRHRLKNWYKIAIVRHPFDRLASCYSEKFTGNNRIYVDKVGAAILKNSRPNLSGAEIKLKKLKITFQEFIKYVLSGATDDHWRGPYDSKCKLCLLAYDYVVKLETHHEDVTFVVNEKLQGRGLDLHTNNQRGGSDVLRTEGRNLSQYFDQLTLLEYDSIYHQRMADFEMFGYKMNRQHVAVCEGLGDDGSKCC